MRQGSPSRFRNWIACYAAAITIILEQVTAYPGTSVAEAPTPMVRLRERFASNDGWHPDEILTGPSGRRYVLVWEEPGDETSRLISSRFLSN